MVLETRFPKTIALAALLAAALIGCGLDATVASPTPVPPASPALTPIASATPTVTPPPTSTPRPTPVLDDRMRIAVLRDTYQPGEEVTFTITNRSERALFYLYGGCGWPTIRRLEGGEWVGIVVNITEEYPPITELAPGEQQICSWDQRAWQDLRKEGPERFDHFRQLARVPPGQYRFSLYYYTTREDAEMVENVRLTHSEVFLLQVGWAAPPDDASIGLREDGVPRPTCLVLGTQRSGVPLPGGPSRAAPDERLENELWRRRLIARPVARAPE